MEIILFLIIAGILSSIFGKAKGKNKTAPIKPFTAKRFNDIRTKIENPHRQKRTAQVTAGQPEALATYLAENQVIKRPVKDEAAKLKNEQIPLKNLEAERKPKTDSPEISYISEDQSIINGVIWAEILGPPRAKRPYYTQRK